MVKLSKCVQAMLKTAMVNVFEDMKKHMGRQLDVNDMDRIPLQQDLAANIKVLVEKMGAEFEEGTFFAACDKYAGGVSDELHSKLEDCVEAALKEAEACSKGATVSPVNKQRLRDIIIPMYDKLTDCVDGIFFCECCDYSEMEVAYKAPPKKKAPSKKTTPTKKGTPAKPKAKAKVTKKSTQTKKSKTKDAPTEEILSQYPSDDDDELLLKRADALSKRAKKLEEQDSKLDKHLSQELKSKAKKKTKKYDEDAEMKKAIALSLKDVPAAKPEGPAAVPPTVPVVPAAKEPTSMDTLFKMFCSRMQENPGLMATMFGSAAPAAPAVPAVPAAPAAPAVPAAPAKKTTKSKKRKHAEDGQAKPKKKRASNLYPRLNEEQFAKVSAVLDHCERASKKINPEDACKFFTPEDMENMNDDDGDIIGDESDGDDEGDFEVDENMIDLTSEDDDAEEVN